jgi:LuxR family maltose regulon positive regulatory protein
MERKMNIAQRTEKKIDLIMAIEPVTERELEILQLIGRGYTNREIAEILTISANTVKTHASNIYGKFGVRRRTQAVALGRDLGLL